MYPQYQQIKNIAHHLCFPAISTRCLIKNSISIVIHTQSVPLRNLNTPSGPPSGCFCHFSQEFFPAPSRPSTLSLVGSYDEQFPAACSSLFLCVFRRSTATTSSRQVHHQIEPSLLTTQLIIE